MKNEWEETAVVIVMVIIFLIMPIFTFGNIAAKHAGEEKDIIIAHAIMGAGMWPLYWSWEAQERKEGER
jgi:hypothetical protein